MFVFILYFSLYILVNTCYFFRFVFYKKLWLGKQPYVSFTHQMNVFPFFLVLLSHTVKLWTLRKPVFSLLTNIYNTWLLYLESLRICVNICFIRSRYRSIAIHLNSTEICSCPDGNLFYCGLMEQRLNYLVTVTGSVCLIRKEARPLN